MAAASATGHYVPPMIIFPGQRFSYNPLEGVEEAAMGRSDSGWMDAEVFCEWLKTVFIPAIDQRNVKKPVMLFIDGHTTHITIDASDICLENGIELYCLLEHASHIMQPLDLCLFSSLKSTWKQSVRDWQTKNIGDFVTKKTFARVFKKAWEKSATVDVAVKGFVAAGLFPLNPTSLLKSVKLEPSKMFSQGQSTGSLPAAPLTGVSLSPGPSVSNVCTPASKSQIQTSAETTFAAVTFSGVSLSPGIDLNASTNASTIVTTSASCTATLPDQHETTGTPETVCTVCTGLDLNAPTIVTTSASCTATLPDQHETAATPDAVSDIQKSPIRASAETVCTGNEPPTMSVISTGESLVNVDAITKVSTYKLVTTNPIDAHPSTLPSTSASLSPFSKHLKYPVVPRVTTKAKRAPMPKAITGSAYRKLLLERREKKEKEIREKLERKQERERKKKEKGEEKQRKKVEQLEKKKKRETEEEKRRAHREEMLQAIMQSDSDDSAEITPGICYSCDKAYDNFIQCTKCFRRFHIECVEDEFIADIEFECKYC